MEVGDASGIKRYMPVCFVDQLEFGPVAMGNVGFLIDNLDVMRLEHNEGIAGIIGIQGLDSFTIEIDYPNKRIAITDERLDASDPSTSVFFARPGYKPMIPMSFVDPESAERVHVVWGLLDTGNMGPIDLKLDSATPLIDHDQTLDGYLSSGLHDIEHITAMSPVRERLRLGETTLEGMHASINGVQSRLGSDVLQSFRIKLDGRSNLVSFTRPDNARRLVSIDKLGISYLFQFDGIRADAIAEGSVAEHLGMRSSDKVLLIDGKAPDEMYIKTKFWAVADDATTVTIQIDRWSDGTVVDVVLPLDGSLAGLEKHDAINEKPEKFNVDIIMKDGNASLGVMTLDPKN
tara:strand:+ start:26057 stop:27097 length:1041 start_codon:yes stop_codon:yes gene_type:complete